MIHTLFLSTLSLRRATSFSVREVFANFISIHALLAESDCFGRITSVSSGYFYPRSPCGERHLGAWKSCNVCGNFYPRSPCGERRNRPVTMRTWKNFYPRSPCGERHLGTWKSCDVCRISIHALLAESDTNGLFFLGRRKRFLSTLSLRRATWPGLLARPFFIISIHALLAESDCHRYENPENQ